jgi:hypothetical protein
MTVEDPKVVDFVSLEPDGGHLVLTISDHLDWQNELEHILALQDKVNRYLDFLESGEVFETCPDGRGRQVRIDVVLQYPPSRRGEEFFQHAQEMVSAAGVALSYGVLEDVQ